MLRQRSFFLLALACTLATARPSSAATSFLTEIAPLLVDRCLSCHNAAKAKGDYQLQTPQSSLKAGSSGELPIVPQQPERSKIYRLITASDPGDRMPQKSEPLSPREIELLRRWIEEGAKFDLPTDAVLESVVARHYPTPPAQYPRPVPLLALAFSPDGQALAAGAYHEILLLDPSTGTVRSRIAGFPQQIYALDFSPDGKLLAAAAGSPGQVGEFVLIAPATGEVVRRLQRLGDQALAIAFSPDGKRIATGGADNLIRVFDVASGELKWSAEPHTDWIMALCFSADGNKLISGSRDKTVRVLEAQNGEVASSYLEHQAPVFAVVMASDGKSIYSAGRDKNIHHWELDTTKKLREISGATSDVYQLRLGSGFLMASSADHKVRLYDVREKPSLAHTLTGHKDYVFALAFDAPTQRLASGSFDGELRFWNMAKGEALTNRLVAPGLQP